MPRWYLHARVPIPGLRPAGGGREEGPGRPPWFPQHGLPPPGSHPVPGWALPYAALRSALQARWPAFQPCWRRTRGSLSPGERGGSTAPLWEVQRAACQSRSWLSWALLGQEREEGRRCAAPGCPGWGWGPRLGLCGVIAGPQAYQPEGQPGSGAWQAGSGVCGAHTLSIVARVAPGLAGRLPGSPAGLPASRWHPSWASNKGAGAFIWHRLPAVGTCGPRDTLGQDLPTAPPRPAPRNQSVPQA